MILFITFLTFMNSLILPKNVSWKKTRENFCLNSSKISFQLYGDTFPAFLYKIENFQYIWMICWDSIKENVSLWALNMRSYVVKLPRHLVKQDLRDILIYRWNVISDIRDFNNFKKIRWRLFMKSRKNWHFLSNTQKNHLPKIDEKCVILE